MKREYTLFLQAVAAALKNEQVDWDEAVSRDEWNAVLKLAEIHRVLPMVYQAVYACPAAAKADRSVMAYYRAGALQMVVAQTRKTAGFLPMLQALRDAGVEPLVVKGITCRMLYCNPDYRLSADEDVLIPPRNLELCHQVMTRLGFSTQDAGSDGYELTYIRQEGMLHVEIHKSLFPSESTAYGDLNRFFEDSRSRAVVENGIPTLCPTDHMLYLLCHAFKHFIHSGFGLRQVCDLILFANHHGGDIDWGYVLDSCRQIRAEHFAAGLFRIGWKYLNFSLEDSRYPIQWQAIYVDEEQLLEDILQAGVYGSADLDRLHSSSITLSAVSAQKLGRGTTGSLLKMVFPSVKELERKYPYLKNKPMLLPVAWTERLLQYGKEKTSAADSIRIGNDRIELLKRYGVLDKE